MFETLESELPKPTLIVYLQTSADNLKKNIKKRARAYEQSIQSAYLKKIDKQYVKGLNNLKKIPKLHLELASYTPSTNNKLVKEIRNHIL